MDSYGKPIMVSESERVRIVYDPCHAAAVREEQDGINSGDLVALGVIRERKCPTCGTWEQVDSVWGCVYNCGASEESIAKDIMGVTAK